MEFEWDEAKRRSNLARHGIDFRDIPELFRHPRIEDFDGRHSWGEDRWRALGLVRGQVVFCVYTPRSEKLRIITARPATKTEIMLYYGGFWFDPFSD
jgi:uncharacterized DUF497 family protein